MPGPQGTVANPVELDHFQTITEVHWGALTYITSLPECIGIGIPGESPPDIFPPHGWNCDDGVDASTLIGLGNVSTSEFLDSFSASSTSEGSIGGYYDQKGEYYQVPSGEEAKFAGSFSVASLERHFGFGEVNAAKADITFMPGLKGAPHKRLKGAHQGKACFQIRMDTATFNWWGCVKSGDTDLLYGIPYGVYEGLITRDGGTGGIGIPNYNTLAGLSGGIDASNAKATMRHKGKFLEFICTGNYGGLALLERKDHVPISEGGTKEDE